MKNISTYFNPFKDVFLPGLTLALPSFQKCSVPLPVSTTAVELLNSQVSDKILVCLLMQLH